MRISYASSATGFPNADGFIAKFTFNPAAPLPSKLVIVSGDKQTGAAGTVLPQLLVVQVQDAQGNGVAGVQVTFTGSNAAVGTAATLTGIAVTGNDGRASTAATLGTTPGSATVTAAASGLSPVRFEHTVTAGGPVARITGIVKNGSYTANGAPGVILSIFGENLAAAAVSAPAVPFPTTLGGVRVTLAGNPLPLIYVGPTQINVQLPYDVATGDMQLSVATGSQTATGTLKVLPASPGVLYYGDNRAVVVNADGQVNSAATPALAGSVVVMYIVGQGKVNPPVTTGAAAPVTPPFSVPTLPYGITIGIADVPIQFLGLTLGSVGLLQGNVIVPALNPGDYPVVLTVGGEKSNAPVISISRP